MDAVKTDQWLKRAGLKTETGGLIIAAEDQSDGATNCNWRTWNYPPKFIQGQEVVGIRGQVEEIKTTAFLRVLKRVLET